MPDYHAKISEKLNHRVQTQLSKSHKSEILKLCAAPQYCAVRILKMCQNFSLFWTRKELIKLP